MCLGSGAGAACCVGQHTHFRPRLFRHFLLLQPAGASIFPSRKTESGAPRRHWRGVTGRAFFLPPPHLAIGKSCRPLCSPSLSSEKRSISRQGVSVRDSGFRCGKLHGGAALRSRNGPRRCTYRTRCNNMFLCKISRLHGLLFFSLSFRIYVCRVLRTVLTPACLVYLR